MEQSQIDRVEYFIEWLSEIGYKLVDGIYYDESGNEIPQHKVLWDYFDSI